MWNDAENKVNEEDNKINMNVLCNEEIVVGVKNNIENENI